MTTPESGHARKSAASSRHAAPMDEHEVGRSGKGRSGRPAARPGGGGMSFGLKAAILTGLLTLAFLALGLLTSGGGPDRQAQMDEAGYAAAQTLAGTDPEWWTGSTGVDWVAKAEQVVEDIFGEDGSEWWKERQQFVMSEFQEDMDPERRAELAAAKKAWTDGTEKWANAGSVGGGKAPAAALREISGLLRVVGRPAYKVVAAWVREAKGDAEGELVSSYPAPDKIAYDWKQWKSSTPKMDGRITLNEGPRDVTVYVGSMSREAAKKPLRAYVALWRDPGVAGGGGGGGLGILLAILGPLAVGGLAFALANAHTHSVKSLAREIDRLGTGGDPTRVLRTQSGEAAFVARAVERMVGNLEFRSKHGDADLEQIAEKERKVAEEIHGGLLNKNPPRLTGWEVETLYKPGFEIAGDHFEYFRIDADHLGVILLDTNVRGIPAALVVAAARAYVRAAAPAELSPAAVLKAVNRHLAGDLPPGRHVTALYVVIDTREGKATLASAGHLPLLVYRHAGGKVAKVNPEGIALGLDPGPVFDRSLQEGDIPIGIGDRIVLYTDGALNIQNEFGEEYGESRFYESVARDAPKNSQAFVNFVGSAIDQFHLNTAQNDDVTISTVKRLR